MDKHGTDWENDEIEQAVSAYFDMLEKDLRNEAINKLAAYRILSAAIGRTRSSVEKKFQNISAVLAKLEEPWIRGLAPLPKFQHALSVAIDSSLTRRGTTSFENSKRQSGLEEEQAEFVHHPAANPLILEFVDVPILKPQTLKLPEHMERLVRKFDPVMRDFRAREIGEAGEALIINYEREKLLQAGMPELARKVLWVSKEHGDGAGYDIKSYELTGREKFIEVKTTVGSATAPFFMTRNEKDFADEADDRYRISRIFDFRRTPKAFELTAPLDALVRFSPESYRASFS